MPYPPLINVQGNEAESLLKASTWIRYNNVLLTDLLTEAYETEEIRVEDGGQKLVTHQVIKVIGILNPQVNSFANDVSATRGPAPADQMATNINILKTLLLEDRKPLTFSIGGKVMVDSPVLFNLGAGPRALTDSYHGPKPMYCHITNIVGASSYYVRFAIETWTDSCAITEDGRTVNLIQAHRWSMAHDVDGDTWLTSRMVTGHVKFRPEGLTIPQIDGRNGGVDFAPDSIYSPNFFHPIPPGFKRFNVKVQALPNGMELMYSFIDSEQPLPLGSLSPATKLSAEFSLAAGIADGKPANTRAVVHVAAVGPKNQFRMNLLVMAMRIAIQKLQKPGLVMINEVMITYSLDNKLVDLILKAIWRPVVVGVQGLNFADTGFKASDDTGDLDLALLPFRDVAEGAQGSQADRAKSPASSFDGRKGTYLGLCVGSTLVNGCFNFTQPVNRFLKTTRNEKVAEFQNGDIYELEDANDKSGGSLFFFLQSTNVLTYEMLPTGFSNEMAANTGFYEDWQMTTRYHTVHQKAVLPVGKVQAGSPSDTTFVPPQIATLGMPYTLKSVDWTVAWIGDDPSHIILPSPDTGDTNDVILAEDVTPGVPTVCNSSLKAWRFSGTYWYVCKELHSSSAVTRAQFSGTDPGFSPGRSITDPASRPVNTVGLSRFTAGYSPSFVG